MFTAWGRKDGDILLLLKPWKWLSLLNPVTSTFLPILNRSFMLTWLPSKAIWPFPLNIIVMRVTEQQYPSRWFCVLALMKHQHWGLLGQHDWTERHGVKNIFLYFHTFTNIKRSSFFLWLFVKTKAYCWKRRKEGVFLPKCIASMCCQFGDPGSGKCD